MTSAGMMLFRTRRVDDQWRDSAWTTSAVCRDVDPDMFFTDEENAVAVCGSCPVRGDCLVWALESRAYDGVYGGFTAVERDQLRRRHGRVGLLALARAGVL